MTARALLRLLATSTTWSGRAPARVLCPDPSLPPNWTPVASTVVHADAPPCESEASFPIDRTPVKSRAPLWADAELVGPLPDFCKRNPR